MAQQRKVIAKEEDYIRRNIAGRMSNQAKGRRAKLSRLPRLSPPPGEGEAMSLTLEIDERGGDQALVADKIDVMVGDRVLVKDFSRVARRSDVVALVGPNGAGKTTLLATLLGDRKPARGEARLGGSVSAAWFRQDLAQVPRDKTIYDCIADLRPEWTRGRIQNHLGAFGFSGDEVLRNTSVLSGGERARVALALITLARANLLILDEPTNHLDVESIEAVEDALEDYEGTVILVSHDRAFLRELSTRVWAFDGTHLEDYGGPFVEWELHAAERTAPAQCSGAGRGGGAAEGGEGRGGEVAGAERRVATAHRRARRARRARRKSTGWRRRSASWSRHWPTRPCTAVGPKGTKKAKKIDAELKEARRAHDEALTRWTAAVEALSALAGS